MQAKAFLVKKLWLWCLIAFVAEGFYSPAFTAVSSSSSLGNFIEWHQLRGAARKTSSISSTKILSITSSQSIGFDSLVEKHVLVVGGSGRVGGSVVTQLILRGARVSVGATNEENFIASQNRWVKLFPELEYSIMNNVSFVEVNREDSSSFEGLDNFLDFDLVVNTAGPFQGKVDTPNGVLEACVNNALPYIDVCDDYCTAMAAKTKYSQITESPCVISTGCWPGVSSLMAKQLTEKALKEYEDLNVEDLDVKFSFFTAGSGGAGSTLLVATFLILAEKALTVVNGRRREVQAMKDYETVDFGNIVGPKEVSHLNLLETASVHDILGVGSTKSLFGTAPGFWNTLLGVMAQLPASFLSNEELMEKLAIFSLPIVRIVDFFAGATNAMRCDITSEKEPGLFLSALYAHENLEPCVGECVVAFCAAVASGNVRDGLWFPEEAIESKDCSRVLKLASVGAHTVEVNGSNLRPEEVWG